MATNKDFLYGLSKMTFAGKTVGYIEKDSFEWGGSAPESVDVEAEQVPDAEEWYHRTEVQYDSAEL